MAKLLWGKVFYKDQFAGYLRQEPGERCSFTYDPSYLNTSSPPIAFTLPLQEQPIISELHLPAFFDNLVAEGWLEDAQRRLLGKRTASRFELLLAFGIDCAGAVSVIDPETPQLHLNKVDKKDPLSTAIFRNRASLSGIQPKVLLVAEKNKYRVANLGEQSTHIAKFPSLAIPDIIENEWLTLCACKVLIPDDNTVEAKLQVVEEISEEPVLIIKRFDRTASGEKIHFEEFNQLLNYQTFEKYDGHYRDMANFIYKTECCLPAEVYKLFKRIIVGILVGNTDMHFKNFAMWTTADGFRLTPNYDQVAAAIYQPYQTIALGIDKAADRIIGELKAKHIIALGHEFLLNEKAILMAVEEIEHQLPFAKEAVMQVNTAGELMKTKIVNFMERRWKGTFSLIGKLLSKKV